MRGHDLAGLAATTAQALGLIEQGRLHGATLDDLLAACASLAEPGD
jgi:DNA-binding Xre family transcriptional regulator